MDGPQPTLPARSTSIIPFVTSTYVFPVENKVVSNWKSAIPDIQFFFSYVSVTNRLDPPQRLYQSQQSLAAYGTKTHTGTQSPSRETAHVQEESE